MSAEQLLDAAAGAFEVGTLDATSRLTGPVVVGKRPCPRNYFCDKGRIDNYANASKDNTPVRRGTTSLQALKAARMPASTSR